MFLKNSFVFFFLLLHFFSFSLQKEKTELMFPSLDLVVNAKTEKQVLKTQVDLNALTYNDQIVLKRNGEFFYYRVRDKYQEETLDKIEVQDPSVLILYNEKNDSTFYTILVASHTGKMIKK